MKKLIPIIFILTFNSCLMFKRNGIEMKIINNSDNTITNIEFTTTEKLEVIKIDKIKPNECITKFLSMSKNKSDGSYLLTFIRTNGQKETIGSGYYTNGGSLDHWIDFTVDNDTTFVSFDAPIY
ncbi:hypothetical protein UJ101_02496 [Flavobacteriaceae bacterium UJ101]|nr:hypothetical protein UJ101_02496 [Flavobacteriaceae bacterium UJ101]